MVMKIHMEEKQAIRKGPKIPISDLKALADKHGYSQVIAMAWHKETGTESVATYGSTQADCEQAAIGGNLMKKTLGWLEEMCDAKPTRQMSREKLKKENEELKALLQNFIDVRKNPNADDTANLARFVGYAVVAEKHLNEE